MSALKSFCSRKLQINIRSHLKLICSRHLDSSAAYSTERVPVPEVTRTLPGRLEVYEPGYLDKLKPAIPPYALVDIQMKGYDFVILEQLQKLVYKLITSIDIDVAEGWAVRAESWRIPRFEKNSSKPVAEYQLKEYQRVLQLLEVPSTKLSLVIELLQAVTPPGVTCSVINHTEMEDTIRLIPDFEINRLQAELDELGGPSKLALQREKEAKLYK